MPVVFALVLVLASVKVVEYMILSTRIGPSVFGMPRRRLRGRRNAAVEAVKQIFRPYIICAQKRAHGLVQGTLDILRVPPTPKYLLPKYEMVGAVIRTSVTAAEVDNAVAALYNTLEGSEHPIIAFDLEYINDGGQHPNRVDWIQLAIDADVYLFRIGLPPMGLPASLRTLLMDVNIVKVGAGIAGDDHRLRFGYATPISPYMDLTVWARRVYPSYWPTNPSWWTLLTTPRIWFHMDFRPTSSKSQEDIVARVLELNMVKDGEMQVGNWAVDVLSERQTHYAAMDVHSVYQVVVNLLNAGPP